MQPDYEHIKRTAKAGITLSVLPVTALAIVADVERRSQYEATLRAVALAPCECVMGERGRCMSCQACRILVRADSRAHDHVPL